MEKKITMVHQYYSHIGPAKILTTIRPHYFFHDMEKAVYGFSQLCEIYLANKVRLSRTTGLLSKLGPATTSYQILSPNTVGGLGGSRFKKKYMRI